MANVDRFGNRVTRVAMAMLLGSGLVAATQAPHGETGPGGDITVTGARVSPEDVRRQASEFVRLTGVAMGERPVARWEDPICPAASGLPADGARIVEQKIRSIAAANDAPVASEPCQTNIVIRFSADPAALMRAIAARAPRRLREATPNERGELLRGDAPIRWVYATTLRSADGAMSTGSMGPWVGGNAEGGGSPVAMTDKMSSFQQYRSSIISTSAIRVLHTAIVIVDTGRIRDVSLDAVASYAAFVALAEIKAGDSPPPGSILGLFGEGRGLLMPTDRDMAFLGALYRLPLDRLARQQRGYLRQALIEAEIGD